jgi:hypothetical protein
MESMPQPSKVRTFDIEGQAGRSVEPDGRRVWLCECPSFHERANRHPQGFYTGNVTTGLKVVHLAPCDAEAHYDTPRNTLI